MNFKKLFFHVYIFLIDTLMCMVFAITLLIPFFNVFFLRSIVSDSKKMSKLRKESVMKRGKSRSN